MYVWRIFPKLCLYLRNSEEIRFFPILTSKQNMQHVCISTLFKKNTSSGTSQTQGKKKTVHVPSRVDGRPSETDNRTQKVESVGNTLFFHRVDFQLLLWQQMLWSVLRDCIGKSWRRLSDKDTVHDTIYGVTLERLIGEISLWSQ